MTSRKALPMLVSMAERMRRRGSTSRALLGAEARGRPEGMAVWRSPGLGGG